MCAVLLPPDDCFELALRKSGEPELDNERKDISQSTIHTKEDARTPYRLALGGKDNHKLLSFF